jgi:hypothetical protein
LNMEVQRMVVVLQRKGPALGGGVDKLL